jgi:predicted nucleotidyltransferase
MKHDELVSAVLDLAERTNANVGDANWYLFGSAQEGLSDASDIDLLVVCQTHGIADAVRRAVDVDKLARPIHLSILTEAEEAEVRFVERQGCIRVV